MKSIQPDKLIGRDVISTKFTNYIFESQQNSFPPKTKNLIKGWQRKLRVKKSQVSYKGTNY